MFISSDGENIMADKLVKNKYGNYVLGGEMIKGGWVAPPNASYSGENYLTDEHFKNVKESGVNLLFGVIDPETHFDDLLAFFDECEKFGLYTVVPEESVGREDADVPAILERIETYKKRKCVVGINIWDEPGYDRIGIFSRNLEKIRPHTGNLIIYTNHMPLYAKDEQIYGGELSLTDEEITAERYEKFLGEFQSGVSPDVLSYDFYPFRHEKGVVHPRYFEQLCLSRKIAEKSGAPLWNFTQVTSWQRDSVRNMTYSEIEWLNNTSLACGVSGLNYFCYWTPKSNDELFEHAMVTETGLKTKSYYFVKKANERLACVADEILGARYLGTIAFGDTAAPFPAKDNIRLFGELKQVYADGVLTGCFENEKKRLYYVVNPSVTETRVIELLFRKEVEYEIVDGAERTKSKGNHIVLTIEEGKAVLIETIK